MGKYVHICTREYLSVPISRAPGETSYNAHNATAETDDVIVGLFCEDEFIIKEHNEFIL